MADSAVHSLTEKTSLAATDEFYLVQSPYTGGSDRRTSLASINSYLVGKTNTWIAQQTYDHTSIKFLSQHVTPGDRYATLFWPTVEPGIDPGQMVFSTYTINNVLQLHNLNDEAYSVLGFFQEDGYERGVIGWGNTNAGAYAEKLFIEYGGRAGFPADEPGDFMIRMYGVVAAYGGGSTYLRSVYSKDGSMTWYGGTGNDAHFSLNATWGATLYANLVLNNTNTQNTNSTLLITAGTLTAAQKPVFKLNQTWNFNDTHILVDIGVDDTLSGSGSRIFQFACGGIKLALQKNGNLLFGAPENGGVAAGIKTSGSTLQVIDDNGTLTNLQAKSVRGTAVTYANRPGTPVEGMIVAFTDSNTITWGATIAGSGSNHVLGYYDGTNWLVS